MTRALCLVLFLAGAVPALANGAEVAVVRSAAAVVGCQTVGAVKSSPPYWSRADLWADLRAKAAATGADTLLVLSLSFHTEGVAYRCAK